MVKNMTKKAKYQISKNSFIWINVTTLDEFEIIKKLNNEFDKEKKKEKTYRKKTISLDRLQDEYNYEFADFNYSSDKTYFIEFRSTEIRKAIGTLPERQRQVIVEYFYNDKSLRKIARENNISITTIRESFHSALKKLRDKLLIFSE